MSVGRDRLGLNVFLGIGGAFALAVASWGQTTEPVAERLYSNAVREQVQSRLLAAEQAAGLTTAELKRGPWRRLHVDLVTAHFALLEAQASGESFRSFSDALPVRDELVLVDAVARDAGDGLRSAFLQEGAEGVQQVGRVVSGWYPISRLGRLAESDHLAFARPSYWETRAGSVTTQGDVAQRTDELRTNSGFDGTGVTAGVLSDSYDCLGGEAADIGTGDLPDNVVVLEEFTNCAAGTDEARAMAQIVHDVAPGANLQVHSAGNGYASFVQGIQDLHDAGSNIIVDDVIYLAEAAFLDDLAALKVDEVSADGAIYVSAAGNSRDNAYLAEFVDAPIEPPFAFPVDDSFSPDPAPPAFFGGFPHDFGGVARGGNDVFQQVTIQEGASIVFSFQWEDPFFSVTGGGGSQRDFDFYILDDPPTTVLGGGAFSNLNGDAVEVFRFTNPAGSGRTSFNLMMVLGDLVTPPPETAGAASATGRGLPSPYLYYTWFEQLLDQLVPNEFATGSGTIYGHPNAWSAFTVGAVAYFNSPEFGQPDPEAEPYSSIGGVPILIDQQGAHLAEMVLRDKPSVMSVTGGDTTFFGVDVDMSGFPNFFGTSGAAPHFAGAMVLLFGVCGFLSRFENAQLRQWVFLVLLFAGFIDMCEPGPDYGSGIGFLDFQEAFEQFEDDLLLCAEFEDGTTGEWSSTVGD